MRLSPARKQFCERDLMARADDNHRITIPWADLPHQLAAAPAGSENLPARSNRDHKRNLGFSRFEHLCDCCVFRTEPHAALRLHTDTRIDPPRHGHDCSGHAAGEAVVACSELANQGIRSGDQLCFSHHASATVLSVGRQRPQATAEHGAAPAWWRQGGAGSRCRDVRSGCSA